MPIDATAEGDSVTTSDSAQDTSVTGPVSTDTQATTAPAEEGTTAETAPSQEATPDAANESLHNSTSDTTSHTAQPQVNWEKRYSDLRRREQQLATQLKQYEATYKGVDPSVVRSFQEREATAQKEHLPPWHRQSPRNPAFIKALDKIQIYQTQLQKAQSPEQRQAVAQQWEGILTDAELKDYEQWHEHQRQDRLAMSADPASYFEERIAQIIDKRLQQQTTYSRAEQEVGGWFQEPANQPIIDRFGAQMQEMLQGGVPWQFVQQHVALMAKLDGVQGRVGEAEKAKTSADERIRLIKSQASVSREPNTTRKVDPLVVAKERGIQPGTDAYWDLLTDLKSEGTLA
jgi:hypothetical protein